MGNMLQEHCCSNCQCVSAQIRRAAVTAVCTVLQLCLALPLLCWDEMQQSLQPFLLQNHFAVDQGQWVPAQEGCSAEVRWVQGLQRGRREGLSSLICTKASLQKEGLKELSLHHFLTPFYLTALFYSLAFSHMDSVWLIRGKEYFISYAFESELLAVFYSGVLDIC